MDISNQPIANGPEVAIHEEAKTSVNSSFQVEEAIHQPICTVDFSTPHIQAMNAEVQTGPSTYYNSYYGKSWILHYPGKSYIQVNTKIENLDSAKKYVLDMVHLSSCSFVDGKYIKFSPITILVNGNVVVFGHNPDLIDYKREQFDVTQYVVEGDNQIEIRFDNGATHNYWIQSFALIES